MENNEMDNEMNNEMDARGIMDRWARDHGIAGELVDDLVRRIVSRGLRSGGPPVVEVSQADRNTLARAIDGELAEHQDRAYEAGSAAEFAAQVGAEVCSRGPVEVVRAGSAVYLWDDGVYVGWDCQVGERVVGRRWSPHSADGWVTYLAPPGTTTAHPGPEEGDGDGDGDVDGPAFGPVVRGVPIGVYRGAVAWAGVNVGSFEQVPIPPHFRVPGTLVRLETTAFFRPSAPLPEGMMVVRVDPIGSGPPAGRVPEGVSPVFRVPESVPELRSVVAEVMTPETDRAVAEYARVTR